MCEAIATVLAQQRNNVDDPDHHISPHDPRGEARAVYDEVVAPALSERDTETTRLADNEEFLERALHLVVGCCDAADPSECEDPATRTVYEHLRQGTAPETLRSLATQSDHAEQWADRLAYAVAPAEVIGEHSDTNDPWANALAILQDPPQWNIDVSLIPEYLHVSDVQQVLRAAGLRLTFSIEHVEDSPPTDPDQNTQT